MSEAADHPEHYPVFTEMNDAARKPTDTRAAPLAAAIELAMLLTEFDLQIDDERRNTLICLGGALIRVDQEMTRLLGPATG